MFEGEYLYLQPLIENPAYVIRNFPPGTSNTFPQERFVNTFGGHSGVRLTGKYGLYECSNNHLSGSWSYVQGEENDKVIGGPVRDLVPVKLNTTTQLVNDNTYLGSATSNLRLHYHDADLVCNYHLTDDYAFDLFLLGGLQFLYLDYCEQISYIETGASTLVVTQQTDRWGIGLKAGFDFLCGLPCWCAPGSFSIHAKATGGLLVSCNDTTYSQASLDATPQRFTMQNEEFSHIVPAAELKVGLNYILCFCKGDVAAEVGYNLIYYPNVIDQVTFTPGTGMGGPTYPGLSFDHYTGLGLHGLYAGIGICF